VLDGSLSADGRDGIMTTTVTLEEALDALRETTDTLYQTASEMTWYRKDHPGDEAYNAVIQAAEQQCDKVRAMLDSQTERPCGRCDGCGQLADSEDAEPWTAWTSLPVVSASALLMRLVKPKPCHACNGTGRMTSA